MEFFENNDYLHTCIKGKDLKKCKLYRITNRSDYNEDFQFKTGENIDNFELNPNGELTKGGLYFCQLRDVLRFRCFASAEFVRNYSLKSIGDYDSDSESDNNSQSLSLINTYDSDEESDDEKLDAYYIREVTLDDDELVYVEEYMFKAKKIILGEKILLSDFITEELCCQIIELVPEDFKFIPKELLTEEICLVGINKDGYIFKNLSDELKTNELCILAVQQYDFLLDYVPLQMRTFEVCSAAVTKFGSALEYVPFEIFNDKQISELCSIVSSNNKKFDLKHIHEHFKTYTICSKAVSTNGSNLQYVPEKFKTPRICIEAILDNEIARLFVPTKDVERLEYLMRLGESCKSKDDFLKLLEEIEIRNYKLY